MYKPKTNQIKLINGGNFMELWVTHSRIENGNFDYSVEPIIKQVSDMDEAVEYFDRQIGDQIEQVRRNELYSVSATKDFAEDDVSLFNNLKSRGFWHTCFFEHPNHEGDHFCLGKLLNAPAAALHPHLNYFDWEADLSQRDNGKFDDCITSVKSRGPAKYWMLFEHPKFQGNALLGFGDRNLHDTPGGMDDKASSVIACSISAVAIQIGLKLAIERS